jgi:chitin synthase
LSFFFLSQNIIGDNDPFVVNGSPVGDWVFQFFRQMYILAIVTIFISSLGNRPQGSKSIYVFCMILFAFIMILMRTPHMTFD